jgi:hypothetical protein
VLRGSGQCAVFQRSQKAPQQVGVQHGYQ